MSRSRAASLVQTPSSFFDWLDERMKLAGISSDRELCRRADISPSVISKARNGGTPIGFEAARALARALGEKDTVVMAQAGLVEPEPGTNEKIERMVHRFSQLPPEEQEEFIEYLNTRLERLEKGKGKKK